MPVGPSHSHSRSGGGGFSSRSSGGGFSGRGFGPSFGGMHRGPRHFVFFGRTIVVGGGSSALFAVLIFFLAMSIFVSFVFGTMKADARHSITENQEFISIMEEDNKYYKDMIEKAEAPDAETNGYYTTTATFKPSSINYEYFDNTIPAIYYFDDYNRIELYYIVYTYKSDYDKFGNKITSDSERLTLKGVTYAQYSKDQALGMGGEIEIVYHYDNKESRWVSINKNYTLDLDQNFEYKLYQEYLNEAKSDLNTNSAVFTGAIIVVVILVVCLVLVFVYIIKKSKKQAELEEKKKQAEIDEARAKASEAEANAERKNRICSYCGCSVPDDANKCPTCGASKFKKKSKK